MSEDVNVKARALALVVGALLYAATQNAAWGPGVGGWECEGARFGAGCRRATLRSDPKCGVVARSGGAGDCHDANRWSRVARYELDFPGVSHRTYDLALVD